MGEQCERGAADICWLALSNCGGLCDKGLAVLSGHWHVRCNIVVCRVASYIVVGYIPSVHGSRKIIHYLQMLQHSEQL